MKIQKEMICEWLDTTVGKITPIEREIEEHRCVNCGYHMRFPIVARQEHIEAFEKILEAANEYIEEKGVTEKMLNELLDKLGVNTQ